MKFSAITRNWCTVTQLKSLECREHNIKGMGNLTQLVIQICDNHQIVENVFFQFYD